MTETQNWYIINNIRQTEDQVLRGEAVVHADSPWFSGHFPQEPILPGIAQLHLVFVVINELNHGKLSILGLKKIRFRQVVRPEEVLHIKAVPGSKQYHYNFTITVGETTVKPSTVCSGIMITSITP